MTITRDIVTDLLPLYAAGEVSSDSRAAVEAMLKEDAALRRLADALARGVSVPVPGEPPSALAAFSRTKGLLRQRSWLLSAACFFSGLPFVFGFDEHGLRFFALRDMPSLACAALAAAAGFWFGLVMINRKLRVTGL
jgi:anti-sigma factor RsiW